LGSEPRYTGRVAEVDWEHQAIDSVVSDEQPVIQQEFIRQLVEVRVHHFPEPRVRTSADNGWLVSFDVDRRIQCAHLREMSIENSVVSGLNNNGDR
jgi:hypothetical protein